MTYDIDAIIQASSSMKDAIRRVGDEMGLPNGRLNSDFVHTKSYSPKLAEFSVYYKKFSNILEVRTISGEYLVAMKLMSGRQYKNDISDVVGILREEQERGNRITLEKLKIAVNNLYGNWDQLPENSKELINNILENDQLEELYEEYRSNEKATKTALISFEKNYPGVLKEDNLNDIINTLKQRNQDNLEY